jgi:hypothetical protein
VAVFAVVRAMVLAVRAREDLLRLLEADACATGG